jgi:hypothetical protein
LSRIGTIEEKKNMRKLSIVAAIAMAMTVMTASAAMAGNDKATCHDLLGQVHGFHIVSDYVTGNPTDFVVGAMEGDTDANKEIAWPPTEVNAGDGGAVTPGGPGPGFHFSFGEGVPPGASFCTSTAKSGVIYTNNPNLPLPTP